MPSPPIQMISVRFRVPYPTLWGQSLAVVGAGPDLGDWDPAKGVKMACRASYTAAVTSSPATPSSGHENAVDGTSSSATSASAAGGAAAAVGADPPHHHHHHHHQQQQHHQQQPQSPPPVPVWEACVELPRKGSSGTAVSYKYLLLSEDGSVARREPTARAVALPATAAAAAALLSDTWLDDAEPGALLGRSAFIDAIAPFDNDKSGPRRGGGGGGGSMAVASPLCRPLPLPSRCCRAVHRHRCWLIVVFYPSVRCSHDKKGWRSDKDTKNCRILWW